MRQGEPAAHMYLVIRGRAEAVATVAGQRKVLGEIARGGVIGELGLLRQRPRTADVVALEDMELLVVDERFLRVLRRRYPRIASTVLFNLTRIVGDRYEQVVLGPANA
jgi:CRP-like cAMP-binding protein